MHVFAKLMLICPRTISIMVIIALKSELDQGSD